MFSVLLKRHLLGTELQNNTLSMLFSQDPDLTFNCVCTCVLFVLMSDVPIESVSSPRAGTVSHPMWICWELNSGPLEEQGLFTPSDNGSVVLFCF